MALDIVNPYQRDNAARLLWANRVPRHSGLSRGLASQAATVLAQCANDWTERAAFTFIAETLATNRQVSCG